MFLTRNRQRGFTLVELLIVVIILAILAAVVVPQFSGSTADAKLSALDTTLASMRSAVELYGQQHGGVYPSALTSGAGGAANSAAAFTEQLTKYTDSAGDAKNTKDATHIYGPYLKANALPLEPVSGSAVLVTPVSVTGTLPLGASGTTGWNFDNKNGQFIANGSPTR